MQQNKLEFDMFQNGMLRRPRVPVGPRKRPRMPLVLEHGGV